MSHQRPVVKAFADTHGNVVQRWTKCSRSSGCRARCLVGRGRHLSAEYLQPYETCLYRGHNKWFSLPGFYDRRNGLRSILWIFSHVSILLRSPSGMRLSCFKVYTGKRGCTRTFSFNWLFWWLYIHDLVFKSFKKSKLLQLWLLKEQVKNAKVIIDLLKSEKALEKLKHITTDGLLILIKKAFVCLVLSIDWSEGQ